MEGLNRKSPGFQKFPHGAYGMMEATRGKRQGHKGRHFAYYKVIVLEVIFEGSYEAIREAIFSYRGSQWKMDRFGKVYRIGFGPHGTHKTVTLCNDAVLVIR